MRGVKPPHKVQIVYPKISKSRYCHTVNIFVSHPVPATARRWGTTPNARNYPSLTTLVVPPTALYLLPPAFVTQHEHPSVLPCLSSPVARIPAPKYSYCRISGTKHYLPTLPRLCFISGATGAVRSVPTLVTSYQSYPSRHAPAMPFSCIRSPDQYHLTQLSVPQDSTTGHLLDIPFHHVTD